MAPRLKTTPRKQPRQERARATVDTVLAATAQVLVKHGYEATNTNRIAEAAGVSVGSIYQYFPNKESLVVALIERHCESMWAIIQRDAAAVFDAPPARAVPRVIGAMFDAHLVDPRLHRVLHEQVPRVGALGKVRAVTERAIDMTRAYLAAHRREILPDDIDLAATIVVHVVESITHATIERPTPFDRDHVVAETTAVVLRYLTGASQ
jgi:AcrR family transcriptional regulator